MPSNADAGPGLNLDGDTSMLSIATDAPNTTTKSRVNGKAVKEDADSVGVDVCNVFYPDSSTFYELPIEHSFSSRKEEQTKRDDQCAYHPVPSLPIPSFI
jgi:hypothetical protein